MARMAPQVTTFAAPRILRFLGEQKCVFSPSSDQEMAETRRLESPDAGTLFAT
jgi:hypothetical protein